MQFNLAELIDLTGVQRSTGVPNSHHTRAICTDRYSEEKLRKLLADEKGTARRQELLKAIWKLSQQREEVDPSVLAKNAMKQQPSVRQTENPAVSC
jgi:hypothetical protein